MSDILGRSENHNTSDNHECLTNYKFQSKGLEELYYMYLSNKKAATAQLICILILHSYFSKHNSHGFSYSLENKSEGK